MDGKRGPRMIDKKEKEKKEERGGGPRRGRRQRGEMRKI